MTNTLVICPSRHLPSGLRKYSTPTAFVSSARQNTNNVTRRDMLDGHNSDTSLVGNKLCDTTFVVQSSPETVTFANRPSSSIQHERRYDIIDSSLRFIKSPLSARPTAFDRQAPYTDTSPRDYRYATDSHRSVACPSVPTHHIATSPDRCQSPKRRRNASRFRRQVLHRQRVTARCVALQATYNSTKACIS